MRFERLFLLLAVFTGAGAVAACSDSECAATCAEAGKNCGQIADGCGGVLECGGCPDGQTCGGGGEANVCAPGCTPTTCEAQKAYCGEITDGCGGVLTCGDCGATCGGACPPRYACSADGLCTGGNPEALVLDARTVTISGRVLHNGAKPKVSSTCTSAALRVHLEDRERGYAFMQELPCASPDFAFSVLAHPGTYTVSIVNVSSGLYAYATELPETSARVVVVEGLEAEADLAEVIVDVKSHLLAGTVSVQGAMAEKTTACVAGRDALRISFEDRTNGREVQRRIPCTAPDLSFQARVHPGVWAVSVQNQRGGSSYHTKLPATDLAFTALEALEVKADAPALVLDVEPALSVSGTVTLNGQPPLVTAACRSGADALTLEFRDDTKGYRVEHEVPCSTTDFSWSVELFPGVYSVAVEQGRDPFLGWTTNLPGAAQPFVARTGLEVSAPQTGVALDVAGVMVNGRVTIDGRTPTAAASCSRDAANVMFREVTSGTEHVVAVPCESSDFSFAASVHPGTYQVEVTNTQSQGQWNTDLPWTREGIRTHEALKLDTDTTGLLLEVKSPPAPKLATVKGLVLLRNRPPKTTEFCLATYHSVMVGFTNTVTGELLTHRIPCVNPYFTFELKVPHGTWDVGISNVPTGKVWNSNLPPSAGAYVVIEGLEITGDVPELALNVETVRVAGWVRHDGKKPTKTASCTDTREALEVWFRSKRGHHMELLVPCSSEEAAFEGVVYPGEYGVEVRNVNHLKAPRGWATTLNETTLPIVLVERLQVP